MDGISLKLAANAVPDKEKVLVAYEVVDDSTGKVVAKGTVNLGKLRAENSQDEIRQSKCCKIKHTY